MKSTTLLVTAALAALFLVGPTPARAGGVFVDGSYRAACPLTVSVTVGTSYEAPTWPTSGWEARPINSTLTGTLASDGAFVGTNDHRTMYCIYDSPAFKHELRQSPPPEYTKCRMYSFPWFICTK